MSVLLAGLVFAQAPAEARHNFSMLRDVEPGEVEPGESVSVSGFSYSDTVEIRFDDFDGPLLAELEPDANEDIEGEVQVPSDVKPGRYILYAVQRDDQGDISRFPGQAEVVVGEPGPPRDPDAEAEARSAGLVTQGGPSPVSLLLVVVGTAAIAGLLFVGAALALPVGRAPANKREDAS